MNSASTTGECQMLNYSYEIRPTRCTFFMCFTLQNVLYMFRTDKLFILRRYFLLYVQILVCIILKYTGYLQMNGAVSKVNKKIISHLTRAKRTPLAAANIQVSHALPEVRSPVLTAGLRGQFPRWRRSRKRLSVCSVLRCPDL